ncbi:MAG: gephyrin-like molybdotransferase Glp [Terracidiphilus sp.]|jgi:molybdopterin molybdotransferase
MSLDSVSVDVLSYNEAAALVAKCAAKLARARFSIESVKLEHAGGRVLARPLRADRDQPPFARSTRDGFACRATEGSTYVALPISGSTRAGDAPSGSLVRHSAWEIMTGAPVPKGADAVVMLEHVEVADGRVRLLPPRTVERGENIVAKGVQARKGDQLLPPGTVIGAAQIALGAACGCATLPVFRKPRVAILATGDELVPVRSSPLPGKIRNSNAPMLSAMVAACGGVPWILPTAADNAKALDRALARSADADLLLITGGVSAGKFDLVEPALARAGARFHFTGVRIQPGKPTVFGEIPRRRRTSPVQNQNGTKYTKCYCMGLPGNPVSSAVTFQLFAAPILNALRGSRETYPRFALAKLATSVKMKPGLTRFLPATCTFGAPISGSGPEVALVPWQGSGDIAAMSRANCFLVVPDNANPLQPGDIVRILLT